MTELDFPNLQGFVVRGYRLPFAAYVFLRIDDAAKARTTLGEFIPQVITAERWTDKPASGINLSFSFRGLRALGLDDRSLDAFPAEFRVHSFPTRRSSDWSTRLNSSRKSVV